MNPFPLRIFLVALLSSAALVAALSASQSSPTTQQPAAAPATAISGAGAPPQSAVGSMPAVPDVPTSRASLNVVVLDPAHGGTDPGARGTGGMRESEIVLDFVTEVRHALEQQAFQVLQTRQANENPSFDDRSAMANAQRGAVFVTLHVSSTGIPGTARVYVNTDLPPVTNSFGFIPWDRAQAPFLGLSRTFGDLVQGFLAQRFKGSPETAQTASVRQLRTTAAPAIAVEISSVTVDARTDLDRMAPGIADSIARGAAAFRPSYVIPAMTGVQP